MTLPDPLAEHDPTKSSGKYITFPASNAQDIDGPTLEGRLHVPADGMLHPGAVLCHANPAAGGNMDMGVMLAIESALSNLGVATLRYNSRGVGNSTGTISRLPGKLLVTREGTSEIEDVGAALGFLGMQEGVDNNRLALVGHSFGARISLAYLASQPTETPVQVVVCIGLPVAWRDLTGYGNWPRPKLFVTGDKDDFCPPDLLSEFAESLPEPTTVVTLRNTGHFFEGRENDLASLVAEFVRQVLEGLNERI